MAGRLGVVLAVAADDPLRTLFGETNGCLLAEVSPDQAAEFEEKFSGLPLQKVGVVKSDPSLTVFTNTEPRVSLTIDDLLTAWNTPLQPAGS